MLAEEGQAARLAAQDQAAWRSGCPGSASKVSPEARTWSHILLHINTQLTAPLITSAGHSLVVGYLDDREKNYSLGRLRSNNTKQLRQ